MEQQLLRSKFLVGNTPTIADISLFAYTQVAHEGGFDLSKYTALLKWLDSIRALPNYLDMNARTSSALRPVEFDGPDFLSGFIESLPHLQKRFSSS